MVEIKREGEREGEREREGIGGGRERGGRIIGVNTSAVRLTRRTAALHSGVKQNTLSQTYC